MAARDEFQGPLALRLVDTRRAVGAAATSAREHSPRLWRGLLSVAGVAMLCLACAAAFFATARGVEHTLAKRPGLTLNDTVQRHKFQHFDAHGDDYDVVFVGSSRVYRHLDPVVFETITGAAGLALHAFNFGLPGMVLPEVMATVHWILERQPQRMRWLVIELQTKDHLLHPMNDLKRRVINWYTPAVTVAACRRVWEAELPGDEQRAALWGHLRHALYKGGNVGVALPALTTWAKHEGPAQHRRSLGPELSGFIGLDSAALPHAGQRAWRQRFLEQPKLLDERVAHLRERAYQSQSNPGYLRLIRDLAERVRAAGVQPLFFIAPGGDGRAPLLDGPELPTVFSYIDPDEYPEFYERDMLFDLNHLSAQGAAQLSDVFARDFVDHVRAQARD